MNDHDRVRALRETEIRVAAIYAMAAYPKAGATNLARLHEAQPSIRAARYDHDGGHTTAVADPTGNTAGHPDPAVQDLARLDQHLARLVHHAEHAHRILAAYPPAHHANDADRLALARANTRPDLSCESCSQITEPHSDLPYLKPPLTKNPTTVAGRLKEPLLLCAWCTAYVSDQGALPTKEQLEAHRDGRRVLVKDTTPRRSVSPMAEPAADSQPEHPQPGGGDDR